MEVDFVWGVVGLWVFDIGCLNGVGVVSGSREKMKASRRCSPASPILTSLILASVQPDSLGNTKWQIRTLTGVEASMNV